MKKKRKSLKKQYYDEDRGRMKISSWIAEVHPEIKKIVVAIALFVLAGLFVLSYTGKGGVAGGVMYRAFDFLFGYGYFFAPIVFSGVGLSLFWSRDKRALGIAVAGGMLCLAATLGGFHILFGPGSGGIIGKVLGAPLLGFFDFWASALIVGALFSISLLLILNIPFWRRPTVTEEQESQEEEKEVAGEPEGKIAAMIEQLNAKFQAVFEKQGMNEIGKPEQNLPPVPTAAFPGEGDSAKDDSFISLGRMMKSSKYSKPPIELLEGDSGKPSSGDIKANSNIIKRTLENFGIMVEMAEIYVGPTVTQYTLRPAEGVKLSRIVGLHNDLSLALAAHPIRIEAPIPGKSLVGIEVPNRSIARVGLRALIEDSLFLENTQPLLFALGRDVAGSPVFADLSRMPHLLVSGATGSGKSAAIHSFMTSFLYRNPPELLRFILVDPKRVELSVYNDVPHLLRPVITDAKTAIQTLRWATKEMDRRYELLSEERARDITGYNAKISRERSKPGENGVGGEGQDQRQTGSAPGKMLLPYLVIIIDELADLMATFPREVESSIIRLAQMARAVGIHLIVATQRPSVEVITGLIKANITSRIAFQVASQIDSRTIIDTAGAEKLLGNGDMLFLAGDTARPRRIQGAFVSEHEVKRVVDFLHAASGEPEFDEEVLMQEISEEDREEAADLEDDDPLYHEAKELVVEAQKASASYLQRRLRVGYARAARLIDLLEQNGVVGPGEGAKPRAILTKSPDERGIREG